MEVLTQVCGEDGVTIQLPEGLIGAGPPWHDNETFECLICGGDFFRDISLEGTLKHMETAHGILLGQRVATSSLLGSNGQPMQKTVAASLFSADGTETQT